MNKKLIIYGIGKLAEYAYYVFMNDSPYEVVGFCVESRFIKKTEQTLFNIKVYDSEKISQYFSVANHDIFIAVGNNSIRNDIYEKVKTIGYSFANYISSKAQYWHDCKYGNNVLIGEGCIIQPFVSIGNNTLIFASIVGHHCQIAENSTLSGCCIGGSVKIGKNTFIGMNTSVNQNVNIGSNNIIGVGCNITKDTKDNDVYSATKSKLRIFSSSKILHNFLK